MIQMSMKDERTRTNFSDACQMIRLQALLYRYGQEESGFRVPPVLDTCKNVRIILFASLSHRIHPSRKSENEPNFYFSRQ